MSNQSSRKKKSTGGCAVNKYQRNKARKKSFEVVKSYMFLFYFITIKKIKILKKKGHNFIRKIHFIFFIFKKFTKFLKLLRYLDIKSEGMNSKDYGIKDISRQRLKIPHIACKNSVRYSKILMISTARTFLFATFMLCRHKKCFTVKFKTSLRQLNNFYLFKINELFVERRHFSNAIVFNNKRYSFNIENCVITISETSLNYV